MGTGTADDRKRCPRQALRVGDVFSRLENNGVATFWRIAAIRRDWYGVIVETDQVR